MNQSFKVWEEKKKCYNKKIHRKKTDEVFVFPLVALEEVLNCQSQKIRIVLHEKKDYRRRKIETKGKTDTFNGQLHQWNYLFTCTSVTTFSRNVMMSLIWLIAIGWWWYRTSSTRLIMWFLSNINWYFWID
jgi:hypothetical protein